MRFTFQFSSDAMLGLTHRTTRRAFWKSLKWLWGMSQDRSLLGLMSGLFVHRETLLFWRAEKVHAEHDIRRGHLSCPRQWTKTGARCWVPFKKSLRVLRASS
jgi:hypothetical protein